MLQPVAWGSTVVHLAVSTFSAAVFQRAILGLGYVAIMLSPTSNTLRYEERQIER